MFLHQHPFSCLVTNLKLDQSVYYDQDEYEDASFADPRCYWWCELGNGNIKVKLDDLLTNQESECFEILDGRTGKIFELNIASKISSGLMCKSMQNVYSCKNSPPSYSVIDYKIQKDLMMKYFESVQPTNVY